MQLMFPADSFKVLAAWFTVGLILVGLGNLVRWLSHATAKNVDDLFLSFWVGWACLLFILECWHLVLPVDARAFGFVAVLGVVGIAVGGRQAWKLLLYGVPRNALAIILLAVFAACLSNLALDYPRHGDTGAYFLAAVDWAHTYPVVPGLGNLSVLLGFNQSHFLYCAWLDVGPLTGHWPHIANGMLILVLAAQSLLGVSRLILWHRSCAPKDLFFALLLPAGVLAGFGIFLTSPSPDLPIFVLGIVLSGEFVAFMTTRSRDDNAFALLSIALLAVAGVTVKSSFGGLAAATLFLSGLVWLWRNRLHWHRAFITLSWVTLIVIIYAVPWIAHSVVLTGFPFYPSSYGAYPVEWLVQVDWSSWTGRNMSVHYKSIYQDTQYFLTRLGSLGWADPYVIGPLVTALAAMILGPLAYVVRLVRRRQVSRQVSLLILLPLVASFIFVFANAPMARYFGAVFWLLAAEATLLALGWAVYKPGQRVLRALLATVIVSGAFAAALPEHSRLQPRRGFGEIPRVPLKEVHLSTGLSVQVPARGCSCWLAPLPCTPAPNQALRLRRKGDLSSGFMIDASIEWSRHPDGDPRCQMGKPRAKPDIQDPGDGS